MNSPFLFACGVPRSGTTVLQRMLNHHPELAVVNDSHFIPRALERTDKSLIKQARAGISIPLTPELAENVQNYHRFYRMGLSPQEFETVLERSSTYQELVSGLYEMHARKNNKRLAGEKTPDYVRRLSLLHGLFPSAKLIHLVRDGRDVALSLLEWATPTKGPGRIPLWDEEPIAVCALWWRYLTMASIADRDQIAADRYIEIQYDRLINWPQPTLEQLCDFLGLPFSDQMAQYHIGKSKQNNDLSAKSAWLAPRPGLRNWRTDMADDQVELFEVLAGDALEAFGFSLRSSSYSDRTLETADRCQSWWNKNFGKKKRSSEYKNPDGSSANHFAPEPTAKKLS